MISLLLAIIGLINAIWLTFVHFINSGCGQGLGCSELIHSAFGQWFGVPVAIFGAGFFVFVILNKLVQKNQEGPVTLLKSAILCVAFLASGYFIAVQVLVLKQWCWFCFFNHVVVYAIVLKEALLIYEAVKQKQVVAIDSKTDLAALGLGLPLLMFQILMWVSPIPKLEVSANQLAPSVVDGKKISLAVIDAKAKLSIQDNAQQLYEIRKGVIDTMVLEKAAQKEGLTPNRYLQEKVSRRIQLSTTMLDTFISKQTFPEGVSYAQKKAWAERQLFREEFEKRKGKLIDSLYKQYKVTLNLPQPVALNLKANRFYTATKGPENAKIKLTVFSDYQCPSCKLAHDQIDELIEAYPNKIYLEARHYPLSSHSIAKSAAMYAICMGQQEKFWPFNAWLYTNQKTLSVSKFNKQASSLNADMKKLRTCLDSKQAQNILEEDMSQADALGIHGTPLILFNGLHKHQVPTKSEIDALLSL